MTRAIIHVGSFLVGWVLLASSLGWKFYDFFFADNEPNSIRGFIYLLSVAMFLITWQTELEAPEDYKLEDHLID